MKKKTTFLWLLFLLIFSLITLANGEEKAEIIDGVVYGNYIVTDENIEEAKEIRQVKGDYLSIEGKEVYMPKLESVEGYLYLLEGRTELLDLPVLEEVGGITIGYRSSDILLEELYLPNLRRINGNLKVEYNYRNIKRIILPCLEFIEGRIDIHENYDFEHLDLRSLKKVRRIMIYSNHSLRYINLDSLEEADKISISSVNMDNFNLNNLKRTNSLSLTDSSYQNISLEKLSIINGLLVIVGNRNLKSIFAPELKKIGVNLKGVSIMASSNSKKPVLIKVNTIPECEGLVEEVEFVIIGKEKEG
ncbi:MAG: hypothetical protein GX175_04965 [Halanaerobiaceae bacterium]|nr:hypothetical protein [Halanaerobiaceae bacterium]